MKTYIIKKQLIILLLFSFLLVPISCKRGSKIVEKQENLDITEKLQSLQSNFVDWRLGMFLHYNMGTYTQTQWTDPNDDPKKFAPDQLNCQQWAKAAKSAKMEFMVLTTKHHDGFCLWDSDVTEYDVANSSYPKDVLREYVNALRAENLKVGFYFSIWDRTEGIADNPDQKQIDFIKAQLTELLTRYGKIDLLVLDGWFWKMGMNEVSYPEIRNLVRKLQPDCLVTDHTHIIAPYHCDVVNFEGPFGGFPEEGNTTPGLLSDIIVGNWFWVEQAPLNEPKSVSYYLEKLKKLEARYCNLLINCSPNPNGLLDDNVVQRLAELGKAWSPNKNRLPLPKQQRTCNYPVTPFSVTASSGDSKLLSDARMYDALHKNWEASKGFPQTIIIDLGTVYDGLDIVTVVPNSRCLPKPETALKDGNITHAKLYVGQNQKTFSQVAEGQWKADATMKRFKFSTSSARFLKIEILSAHNGRAIINEIDVGSSYHEPIPKGDVLKRKQQAPILKGKDEKDINLSNEK